MSTRDEQKQWTIMVVDDTADDACLLQLAAERVCSAIRFDSMPDGESALKQLDAAARTGAPIPDLVLLDFNMPGMNGLTVWKRLQTDPRFRHVPVLIWTTQADVVLESQRNSGAARFVQKPRDMSEFRSLVLVLAAMAGAIAMPGETS